MKKGRTLKSVLSLLLAVTMLFQQTGITTLASEDLEPAAAESTEALHEEPEVSSPSADVVEEADPEPEPIEEPESVEPVSEDVSEEAEPEPVDEEPAADLTDDEEIETDVPADPEEEELSSEEFMLDDGTEEETSHMVYFIVEGDAQVLVDGLAVSELEVTEGNSVRFYVDMADGLSVQNVFATSGEIEYVSEETNEFVLGDINSDSFVTIEVGDGEEEAKPVELKMSVVDADGNEVDPSYTNMDLPEFDEELDLTESVLDVTKAVNVEGTNRWYVDEYAYDYATINDKKVTGLRKELALDSEDITVYSYIDEFGEAVKINSDDVILLHYNNARTVTEYKYEDNFVKVIATVNDPSAIPDNADLKVYQITKEDNQQAFDAYMGALNEQAESIAEQQNAETATVYDEKNTLLYDIALMTPKADEEGNPIPDQFVEIKPENDVVTISFSFKKNQLQEELTAQTAEDITVIHLPVEENVMADVDATSDIIDKVDSANIEATVVETDNSELNDGSDVIEFSTESLSVWAINGSSDTITVPAPEKTFVESDLNLLKQGDFQYLANFGLIGFSEILVNQHICSNFATNKLILKSGEGLGTNDKGTIDDKGNKTKTAEASYIGKEIVSTINGTNFNLATDSVLVFGKDVGTGTFDTGNAVPYYITISGVTFGIQNVTKKYEENNGEKVAANIMQEDDDHPYLDLAAMKDIATKLSKKLSENTASDVVLKTNDSGGVAVVERGTNTIACLNITASQTAKKITVDDSKANHNEPHVLLINVDAEGADVVNIPNLTVSGSGENLTNETDKWSNANIILNIVDSQSSDGLFHGKVINTNVPNENPVSGSILAPAATVEVHSNVNGQIIADKIEIHQEFHRDSITFKNAITVTGGLKVAKTINSSSDCDEFFDFKITPLNGAPGPEGCEEDGTKIAQNQVDGLVAFGYLNFDSLGDYDYLVEEIIPSDATLLPNGQYTKKVGDATVVYDTNKYIITVHATPRSSSTAIGIGGYSVYKYENGVKGEKIDDLTYDEGKTGVVTFENEKSPIKLNFKVRKAVEGEWDNSKRFTFTLRQTKFISADGNTVKTFTEPSWDEEYRMPKVNYQPASSITAHASKNSPVASFASIEGYTKEGTYIYTLTEDYPANAELSSDGLKATDADGYTYDVSEHEVKVVISKISNDSNALKATITYDGAKSLTITNHGPESEEETGSLELTKTIKGDITEEEAAGALTFEVKTKAGKWLKKDGSLSDTAVQLTLADFTHTPGTKDYTLKFENILIGEYTV
ncbi:MAG: hypothetical protein IJX90_12570, partial [Blautia sp.]|nr:hypothetical protein [Blautia sp.]